MELLRRIEDPPNGIGWGKLELLGHRVLYGWLDEVEMAGSRFLRMRTPDERFCLQDCGRYSAAALYGFTPASKEATLGALHWVQMRFWELTGRQPRLPAAADYEPESEEGEQP